MKIQNWKRRWFSESVINYLLNVFVHKNILDIDDLKA
jgi:hypothetical protein